MPYLMGDIVQWRSQAGGHTKIKQGTVIEVVPSMATPQALSRMKDKGLPREGESYMVEVAQGPRAKPQVYWPKVASLTIVERPVRVVPQDNAHEEALSDESRKLLDEGIAAAKAGKIVSGDAAPKLDKKVRLKAIRKKMEGDEPADDAVPATDDDDGDTAYPVSTMLF